MSGTIYTRTYTYTGQNNTAVARSVALSKFRVSGDTTHQIGQILSITYRHTHTRMGVGYMTLLGRLVFSDGSYLDSNADERYIENSVVTFVNTWSNLPTAANLSALTSIRTVYTNGNYSRDNVLYWRANSAHPMTITITYYEEPPTRYAPRVESFIVGRCNELAQGDDEGEYIMTTAKLSLGDSSGLSDARVYMYYIADTPPTPEEPIHPDAQRVELTSRKNDLLAGVSMNTTILTGTWSSAHAWFFTLVFEVGGEVASAADSVGSAFAPIAISREDGGARVGFGGFPRRPIGEHSAEFFSRAYFYGGAEGVHSYSTDEIATGDFWIDGKPIYRRVLHYTDEIAASQNFTQIGTIENIDCCISMSGTFMDKSIGAWKPLSYYHNSSNFAALELNSSGDVRVHYTNAIMAETIVIVEYTKEV